MTEKEWNEQAEKAFKGRRIVSARYMDKKEARKHGWSRRPLVLLDDGTAIYASSDDEGNDGGALFGVGEDDSDKSFPCL